MKRKRTREYQCLHCKKTCRLVAQAPMPPCAHCGSSWLKRTETPQILEKREKKPWEKKPKPSSKPSRKKKKGRQLAWQILGFESYDAYLRSDLWYSIRRKVLCRDSYGCVLCDEAATQVHHQDYSMDVLKGKDLAPLHSLCNECHDRIEFFVDRTKRPHPEVRAVFSFLLDELQELRRNLA